MRDKGRCIKKLFELTIIDIKCATIARGYRKVEIIERYIHI